MISRFAKVLPLALVASMFAASCDAGPAEGIPEKFTVSWRLEKDGAEISSGSATCQLKKVAPCQFWITEPVLTHVPFSSPVRQTETYGSFFIAGPPAQIRQRNPQWPKAMVAVHETSGGAFRGFYAVLKEPGVMDAKTASKGEWDPAGRIYMPWSRFTKGFSFDIQLAQSVDPISKKLQTNRGVGRVLIAVK